MSRFLITTALEESWASDKPVLFLGEWCRRYSRNQQWANLDSQVLPYHWDDRTKLYADYRELQGLHERLLTSLAVQLNQIHSVDHDTRYWRILIGPWLGYFTQMLFDRWESLRQAVGQHSLSETIVLTGQEDALIPRDMGDFTRLFVGDEWNHHIYSLILRRFTDIPCTQRPMSAQGVAGNPAAPSSWVRGLMRRLSGLYERSSRIIGAETDVFLLGTYLPVLDEFRLHRRLGQIPRHSHSIQPLPAAPDVRRRGWVVAGENRSKFELCVRTLIPLQIPTAYLEGYPRLVEQAARMPWPRKPRLIWTSNAQNADEVFKAWAADMAERRVPLVVGQHGGHDGTGLWSFTEEHKIAISDCYLSWGWTERDQPKVRAVGQFKAKRPLNQAHSGQPHALLVTTTVPRQSYHLFSIMASRQWLDYFEDQCRFVDALPPNIRKALVVRLYREDYGWDQSSRWQDRFPDVRLDLGMAGIDALIRQSRLYISTYNATTFLESFTMNVPTVLYWNPKHSELRDSATPYFDALEQVGVFHKTPESAARHVSDIWDDVDKWWSDRSVKAAVDRFKRRYCHLPEDLPGTAAQALRQVIQRPQ